MLAIADWFSILLKDKAILLMTKGWRINQSYNSKEIVEFFLVAPL